jgi:hypothetical protein
MRRVIDILSIAAIVAAVVLFVVLASHQVQASTPLPHPWKRGERTEEAATTKEPFAGFPLNKPRAIAVQASEQPFGRLSATEQRDQILDWLLFAVASDSGLSREEINKSLFDMPPIRYGYMQPVASFEYGDTRSLHIGEGQVIALLPADQPEESVDHLAQIADCHRKNRGQIPATLLVFEYEIDPDQGAGLVTRREPLDGLDLFTAAYGYHEAEIASLADLEVFLAQVDDITFARASARRLTLGGRRVWGGHYLGVTVEDVAAIWQAHLDILDDLRAFERRWEQKVDQFEHNWSLRTYRTESERRLLEQQMEEEWEQLTLEQALEQQELGLVNGTGFSLDPVYDYAGLADFLWELRPDFENLAADPDAPITLADIQEVERGLFQQDVVPFLLLADKLSNSPDLELAFIGEVIDFAIDSAYKFQTARYDGNLQGTEAGMTLFYTDLLAKLWAIDFQRSAPRLIEGFTPMTNMQLPPIYQQEMEELPSTRLWFGPRNGGFQLADGSNELLFARVATRVYAASSNPLEPGVEVEPNIQSGLFLGWWNDHYEKVARHEPQYQRLNEIMKWSLLASWLGKEGQEDILGFLVDVDVERSQWFPDWAQAQPDLQYQDWDSIDFFPAGYLGTETEAIAILFSDPYTLFSDDEKFGHEQYLAGGVSLADVHLFDEIAPLSHQVDDLLLRSTIDYSYLDDLFTLQTLDDIQYAFTGLADELVAVTSLAKGENVRLRSVDSEVTNQPFQRIVNQGRLGSGLEFEVRAGGTELGALDIAPMENGFSVGWLSRDIDAGHQLALDMSKGRPIPGTLLESGEVQAVVDLADDGVLAQMKGSGGWLRFAEEGVPSARVPSGWQSRVADPQNGVQGILLGWGDDATAQLERGGYLLKDPTEPALFRFVGDDLPDGLRTVEIEGGDLTFSIKLDAESGEVYFRVKDLPEQDLSLMQDLTRPSEIERMRIRLSEATDEVVRYAPENPLLEQIHLDRCLDSGNYESLARTIAADSGGFKLTLNKYLDNKLKQVDDLLASGKAAEAIRQLDDLIGFYGHRPGLDLRKGLALLDDGQLELVKVVGNESTVGPLQSAQPFFDEINGRLSLGGLGQAEEQNLYHFAEFVDWRSVQAQGFVPEGRVALSVDKGALSLEYHLPGELVGEPVPLSALDEGGTFYIQDTPGLNNLDWSPGAFQPSLNEAVSGDLGRVIRLPQGDVAHYRPGCIYDAVGERFALVSQPTIPVPKGYIFHVGSVFDPCGDDGVCEEREQAVYIVVEQ